MLLYTVMDSSLERALNVDYQPMHLLESRSLGAMPPFVRRQRVQKRSQNHPATAIETWLSTRRRLRHNPATLFSELLLPPRLEADH